jgi:hypothetical protein
MTQIPFPIKLEIIPGSRGRFNRLYENWPFYSDVLGCWSMAPAGTQSFTITGVQITGGN